MKRILGIVALIVIGAAFAGQTARADSESHVYFENQSDAWVWVTAYSGTTGGGSVPVISVGKAEGAWCVPPGAFDKHGLRVAIYEVRAEVSARGCQQHPVLLNQLRGFPYAHAGSKTMTYYIHGAKGHGYTYGNR